MLRFTCVTVARATVHFPGRDRQKPYPLSWREIQKSRDSVRYADDIYLQIRYVSHRENMSDSGRIVICVDGSGSGHSAAHFSDDEVYITHQKGATNNEAEYNGVMLALEHLPVGAKATIQSDSQLVVNQLNGKYRINYPHLSRKKEAILALIEKKKLDVRIEWIPRDKNKADADIRNRHAASGHPVKASATPASSGQGRGQPESAQERIKQLEDENARLRKENGRLREQIVELKVLLG